MKLGIDVLLEGKPIDLKKERIGLVTNVSSVNRHLEPTMNVLHQHPDFNLTALYGPEHGVRNHVSAGENVSSFTDSKTGLPVYSLYGDTRKPSESMLEDIDVLLVDLQDIGARYYTYIYTMSYIMEACREYGKSLVVLDRPNPIGGSEVEGNLIEPGFTSFIGRFPIPNRHGLTIGEMALLFKYVFKIDCDLTVVPMEGWSRHMFFDDTYLSWCAPSPSVTGMDMMLLYPGTCLLSGTNLSAGRGTTKPFEYVGAPFIDGDAFHKRLNDRLGPKVRARPISFTPAFSIYEGTYCEGVQLHIIDRSFHAVETGLILLETVAEMYPDAFTFKKPNKDDERYHFDLSAGTDRLRQLIWDGHVNAFLQTCKTDVNEFKRVAYPHLLYR